MSLSESSNEVELCNMPEHGEEVQFEGGNPRLLKGASVIFIGRRLLNAMLHPPAFENIEICGSIGGYARSSSDYRKIDQQNETNLIRFSLEGCPQIFSDGYSYYLEFNCLTNAWGFLLHETAVPHLSIIGQLFSSTQSKYVEIRYGGHLYHA